MNKTQNKIWDKLTGDRALYSMENRAFNFISVISFLVVIFFLITSISEGIWSVCIVLSTLLFILSTLYYYSLVKKKYKIGIIVYALSCYGAILTNYFLNSGIEGPSMYLFFLTLELIVAVSPNKYNRLWISLHLIIAFILIYTEYNHPDFIPYTYPDRFTKFLDHYLTYVASILFIFFITTYLKNYYKEEKHIADERLLSIIEQNEQITKQNLELERINEEKNKMFSIVSHDVRSPIDSIKGYLEVLSDNIIDAQEKKDIEGELLRQVKYTSDLLQNLLYWSKAQMKGVNVKLVPIKLINMIDDARNFKLAGAAKKGIKLTYSIDRELEVIADKDMLKIVLRNLVMNAIKFTPEGGEISIKVARNNETALISIQDNGIGIPADQQKEIFTLKSNSTFGTNDEKGVGLGLILCKEFIEYQNGSIWFESEPGKGSVFFISLPLSRH